MAIEGNTLTLEQVQSIYAGDFSAPQSRAYQEREVRNVLEAFERLDDMVTEDGDLRLSAELICDLNRWVLEGVDPDAALKPGATRTHSVVVGSYVGPSARDCWHLLERLADWLDGDDFRPSGSEGDDSREAFARTVLSALLAHLYIAWIHPFGDGNGRTARLLEYLILARSGRVPLAAANLMANHFNLTRDRYYSRLAAASRERDVLGFLEYGIEGLVDGLVEHSAAVRAQHLGLAWQGYVAETMARFPTSPASERQRALVMALEPAVRVPRPDVAGLTPQLAQMYARTGPRTLARDLNRLEDAGLIEVSKEGIRARIDLMSAFLLPTST
ncbi:Fic family protein [Candidatus Poriferisodalis sp.]|uniref:Fic family protein n=1 Tax=Candidatus Poriferisodalis sp. TaxID=3101277 RepID=UPI003B02A52A